MNLDPIGGRAVVTGANRGLGLELVRRLVAAGIEVHAGCRRPEAAGELASSGPAAVSAVDLADAASIARFAAEVDAAGGPVDLLVNNAGINATALGHRGDGRGPLSIDPEVMLDVVRVNTVGPMLLTRALAGSLRRSSQGRVLNISSQLGSPTVGRRGDVAYNASKAAFNMVTVMTAEELRSAGVAVVCVHPGWVRTDMGGASAPLEPADAAAGVLAVAAALTVEGTGRFLRWDGTEHPW